MSAGYSTGVRTLADELRARDDDGLAALLGARPDLVAPVPTDMTNLVARATTRTSVARALDALDRFTLQVLDGVAHQGEPGTLAALERLVPAPAAAVERALDVLRERALVWGPDDNLRVVRTVRELLGPGPGGTGPPLAQAAAGYRPSRLAQILADLGLPGEPDPPAALTALTRHLSRPATLAALLEQAPAGARQLLTELDAGGGVGTIGRADRDVTAATANGPIEWLLARGILVALDGERAVLPAEVAVAFRGGALHPDPQLSPPELTASQVGVDAADRAGAGAAMTFVRRVEDLLDEWALDPPVALRTGGGGLGVRDLKRVQAAVDGDAFAAALLVETAFVAGLVATESSGTSEIFLPTPEFDRWRAFGTGRRWAALAAAWLASSRVVGLVGSRPDGKDKSVAALGRELDRGTAPEIRLAVLSELASLTPGQTTGAVDILARLTWQRPRRGGALRPDLVRWTLTEAELLGVTGRGALTSYGRALIAGEVEDAVSRLSDELPQPLDHVMLQADLTAIAPGPLVRSLAADLSLAADVESTGGATVFRFTDASIRRALDAGRSAADLHELFARASRTPVPQPLTYLVDDVARRHGRIRVGTADAYLRCDDETVVSELVSDRRAAKLGLRKLAPTVAIASVAVDTVLATLRELGYAPAAESATGAVVLRRPDARRTGPRTAPKPVLSDRPAPTPQLRAAAVRALRAGDRAAAVGARRSAEEAERPSTLTEKPTSTSALISRLRAAADAQTSLWLGYVGDDGTATDRIVDPIAVEGGVLKAFDHRQARVRSFALSRISAVADA
ncbi:helicase-associated domain-containing protein [Sporichthya brevicatena]|uniref:Helicase-associated domain-containing protein n=1 Tax=Sporichthya brevicatena TaxID=171442 RepID=A0ABP3RV10_9ACTN